jgi:hypothetical protein
MGDRTWAKLYVPTELTGAVQAIFNEASNEEEIGDGLSELSYDEMNYGNLPDGVQDKLTAAGVPFDWEWGDGGDYGGGQLHIRFTETGELHLREVYNVNQNPNLEALLDRIDQPDELVQFIKDHANKVTTLSWYNQVEYGKRYRMRQLVLPTK